MPRSLAVFESRLLQTTSGLLDSTVPTPSRQPFVYLAKLMNHTFRNLEADSETYCGLECGSSLLTDVGDDLTSVERAQLTAKLPCRRQEAQLEVQARP